MLVGLLASAIRLHLITLDKQSEKIEYKQVARTVVSMVASDLRNAIQHKPIDLSVLEELAASQQAMLGNLEAAAAGEPPAGNELGGNGENAEQAEASSEEETEQVMADESEVVGRPSIVGTPTALSVDVSRIPRIDEYNSLTAGDVGRLPSDIKNVAYFVENSNNKTTEPQFQVFSKAAPGGLYRRSIDRAVATNREEVGIVNNLDGFAETGRA